MNIRYPSIFIFKYCFNYSRQNDEKDFRYIQLVGKDMDMDIQIQVLVGKEMR